MQFVQAFQLIVDRHELVADVTAVIDPGQGQKHRFHLGLAIDQHAAFR